MFAFKTPRPVQVSQSQAKKRPQVHCFSPYTEISVRLETGCEGRGSEGQSLFKGIGWGGHGRLSALDDNWSWACLNDLLKIDYKAFKSLCPDQNHTIKASSLLAYPPPPIIKRDIELYPTLLSPSCLSHLLLLRRKEAVNSTAILLSSVTARSWALARTSHTAHTKVCPGITSTWVYLTHHSTPKEVDNLPKIT